MKNAARSWFRITALGLALTATACVDNSTDTGNAPAAAEAVAAAPVVVMTTNKGSVEIELYPDKAPASVENFLNYAESGFYDGTVFHRVIPEFMIQGGGYDGDGNRKDTRPPISNEADNGLKNTVGTIAMARTSAPDSATAQFFINVKENTFLDHKDKTPQGWGYAVFGKVIAGMDVVKAIETTPTADAGGAFRNQPTETVIIESIRKK
jgi:cyclophilin family peptidyl-prolyl cis-trans isomerase